MRLSKKSARKARRRAACSHAPAPMPARRCLPCIAALLLAGWVACAPAQQRPVYGEWGYDDAGGDAAVAPGEDFFRHVNGAWLARTDIPADRASHTLRDDMSDTIERRLHALLESSADPVTRRSDSLEGKVGAFYASFMDERRIAALGFLPVKAQLDALRRDRRHDDLAARMGRTQVDFESSLFNFYIHVDLKDPKRYAVHLTQGGLGLPDRDYYLKPDFLPQLRAYERYIARLLTLAGWQQAGQAAREVVAFETRIARASWSKAERRDPLSTYNPMSVAELAAMAPGFGWEAFLRQAGLGDVKRLVVAEKSAVPRLAALFAATPLATLRTWQAAHVLDNASYYLSKPFSQAYFEFHRKTLSGQLAQQDRWKLGVVAVSGDDDLMGERVGTFGNLSWAVGQLYVARHFPPESRQKIEALVGRLIATFRSRIERLDWMGPATRAEALRKLDTYTVKVGYPEHPRDYSTVRMRADDLVGNVRRAAAANWAFYLGRLNGPVDRTEWRMTPQTNDAYNGRLRDIVFPAGILQPPVFDAAADPAINFGAIGGAIGHELIHGFDDKGRSIDADGVLRDWWSPDDARAFEARAQRLVEQYAGFEPLPGMHVDGRLTLGENIADLGGLSLALDAYRDSLKGQPAPVIGGYTGEQRVFIGWAQSWRGKLRDDAVRRQLVSDPHAPRQLRVNAVLRNIDAWYDAFGIQPQDPLYLPADQRVRIW